MTPVLIQAKKYKNLPGFEGRPIRLTEDERSLPEVAEGFKRQEFNEYVCNKISIHRVVKDNRAIECQKKRFIKKKLELSEIIYHVF